MPSTKRAFSTTSVFLFTMGAIAILLGTMLIILTKNTMHFLPTMLKVLLSLAVCGGAVAMVTSMIGIYSGFQLKRMFIYIYIGGTTVTAIFFIATAALGFVGASLPDWSLTKFWNGLTPDQKSFTEVAYRCCGFKSFQQDGCAFYPIAGEVMAPCYSKLFFPYNALVIIVLIMGALATVLCFSFVGMAIYFIVTYEVGSDEVDSSYAKVNDSDDERHLDEPLLDTKGDKSESSGDKESEAD
ncbi:hypothetical protein EIN_153850 [Entamoeba invadens IP1]|uniref:Tetraspanin-6 n=2 Tax=Entamoeba invadens TaxID=33085 RepID=A0A0A1UCD5_ENTIV|nr:hypothetical protein EIN_153850 [Entamoeba invadens IP1]ELP91348.1 hypothetical protein EIN_153850 [Entamoeba invadens IP1]BAN40749.1 hypothetical protein [Entamoeba invadens]|eukprot:XP_004258119.1 hypothetical protein EIN_153850 [Entamoeba invadens IP1]